MAFVTSLTLAFFKNNVTLHYFCAFLEFPSNTEREQPFAPRLHVPIFIKTESDVTKFTEY